MDRESDYKYLNPELLLMEGDIFLDASSLILRAASDRVIKDGDQQRASWFYNVAAVNHAFAFEMYLKCLLVIEGKEVVYGHTLFKIFESLNPETQGKIIADYTKNVTYYPAYYEGAGKDKKTDFLSMLKQMPSAFTWLRYRYEKALKPWDGVHYELEPLINSVRVVILELSPGIKGFR